MKTKSLIPLGLSDLAANGTSLCYHNLSYGKLADLQAANKEGIFTSNGVFVVNTGKFTGRSAMDKYIVKQLPSEDKVWWGSINRPMEPATYKVLHEEVKQYYQNTVDEIFVFDGYCGAHESNRKKVRFVTETAWHQHFVKNMFIEAPEHELEDFVPDFTIINCWSLVDEKWKKHGLHSEVYITFNVEEKTALIGGAWYGGEMKKGIFSMMHYWCPMNHVLSMHCSANIGQKDDDVCIFFGLSGTGKTTLSTDPHRRLIGDDEHGWDETGIFNFEGGCYAKTANLSREAEPEIFDAAVRFNALLENVWVDPYTRTPDFMNMSLTENGRVSYPIEHIANRQESLSGGHPSYIVFLCCDAFGVLPPIAKLSPGQAMYHFISGYTAKVAGTERGIKEPAATFSPCYGAAFLTQHPMEYGSLFRDKLEEHGTDCYLVNTGWSGGAYGTGKRMSIKTTRSCLDAIFDGSIKRTTFRKDSIFGFEVPETLEGVDSQILDPKNTWADKKAYDTAYHELSDLFANNISIYSENVEEYAGFGPIPESK
jgi:ATP-dependent phosphoenolpyruvate carboxykinase